MEDNRQLSDQYLEHCLTSTPTLEGVKSFICSGQLSLYERYCMEEAEEKRRLERLYKKNFRIGKLEGKIQSDTEIVTHMLSNLKMPEQEIKNLLGIDIAFIEAIKVKLNI